VPPQMIEPSLPAPTLSDDRGHGAGRHECTCRPFRVAVREGEEGVPGECAVQRGGVCFRQPPS
jgi:hypothetical protein